MGITKIVFGPSVRVRRMFAVLTIGNIPIGVMLIATAVVSLQMKAFPAWLGWLSAVTAAAHLAAAFGIVAGTGPLSPGGSVSYVAYVLMVAWILATTIVMVRRIGRLSAEAAHLLADAPYGEVHSRSSGLS